MPEILSGLVNVKVPGRSEVVEIGKSFTVVIDYAHTPSSLEAILSATKSIVKAELFVSLDVAEIGYYKTCYDGRNFWRLSNFSVITTDNPRNENPKIIMIKL